ncbi:cytochrome P450 [Sphingomonas sp. BN140010]|uniref:Cytochrome P450 n=1 Tax=Sphingomonas arvum TaxID=2992113 RepID=A0ABT3JBC9_9SPHN|nr:cytochrome P450 [Sphingomonas sp. BN140010]MCW3796374.1 cytochrome P450 [Sphingomonas sp. BN140010]
MTKPFVPTHPPRGTGPVATWRGFFGERARTSVHGWSERMFELPYYQREVLRFRIHVLLDPPLIEHVVLTNQANYLKPGLAKTLLGPVIGTGLLTADGTLWREQRKIVAASFSPAAVEKVRPVFGAASRTAVAEWRSGEVRDVAVDATRATMLIIAETLFSADPRLTSDEALCHIAAALDGISEPRLQALLGLPMVPLTPRARRGAVGQRYLRATLNQLVDERLAAGAGGDDFLDTLITALRAKFAPEEARRLAIDNAATFYLAGHETTSNALAWTLYLLSEQPHWQDRLAAEAQGALGSAEWGRAPVTTLLPQLHTVLQESLRLYPPAPRFDRQAAGEDLLPNGEAVRPGDIVSIWPWLLHRSRRLWDQPDVFDPDRFAPDRPKPGRYQYLPFGAGPRICVGAQFATVEALTILAHWLAEWRFVATGRRVEVTGLVTMRPKDGLRLRVERRS